MVRSDVEMRYERARLFEQQAMPAASGCPKPVLNALIKPIWLSGEKAFFYVHESQSGSEYRIVNAESGETSSAFDHAKFAQSLRGASGRTVNPKQLPITRIEIALRPLTVMFDAFDKRWRFCETSGTCDEITRVATNEIVSPDKTKSAFTRDSNIWCKDLKTGEETQVTDDGEQHYSYGVATVVWGEPNNSPQIVWSPNSKRILTVRRDSRRLREMPRIEFVPFDGSLLPKKNCYRTALPGDEHVETYSVISIDLKDGQTIASQHSPIPTCRSGYGLAGDRISWWASDSRRAYFVDVDRGEKTARVVEFDTDTGASRTVFEETTDTYLRISVSEFTPSFLQPLPESNELVWYSERDGWGHCYLYDLETGECKKQITRGEWLVREVLFVDHRNRELIIQTGGRHKGVSPYYRDVCAVHLDTGEVREIIRGDDDCLVLGDTTPEGVFTQLTAGTELLRGVSPDGDYLVVTRSRVDRRPVTSLIDISGRHIAEIDKCDISGLPDGWSWPEPVEVLADDGKTKIHGVIFRPSNFSTNRQYPVIDASICSPEVGAIPQGAFNCNLLDGLWFYQLAALAELGFIVVAIAGRGTSERDKAFRDKSYGWAPSANFVDDRIAAIRQLSDRLLYLDLDRVGVLGLNGMPGALYSLLERSDFYKVGVQQCLQDLRFMTSIYGELYEGNSRHDHTQAEFLAHKLKGKLLLVHGLDDAMDPPIATIRMVDAFRKANKDVDTLLLPQAGAAQHIDSGYAVRRCWDYFVRHLAGEEPPENFLLVKGGDQALGLDNASELVPEVL